MVCLPNSGTTNRDTKMAGKRRGKKESIPREKRVQPGESLWSVTSATGDQSSLAGRVSLFCLTGGLKKKMVPQSRGGSKNNRKEKGQLR